MYIFCPILHIVHKDGTEKNEDIEIFYREASKLNPAGWGITNHLKNLNLFSPHLHNRIAKIKAMGPDKITPKKPKSAADEAMDDFVIDKDITLIFLHGQHYASSTWEELGTLDYFANLGYKIYGIDMPGYGHSQKVTVRQNGWLIDVITKLISSQDEEGNVDKDGGEHHTDSHEKSNKLTPSSQNVHQIAIVSPDISGMYTLNLLYEHKAKLNEDKGIKLEKFIPVAMTTKVTIAALPTDEVKNGNDVKVCSIAGSDEIDFDDKIWSGMNNAQIVKINGASKHVYLDNPDIFHSIISKFLETDQCGIEEEQEREARNPEEIKQEEEQKAAMKSE